MDISKLIEQLTAGGNSTWLILIGIALLLFKDKLPFLKPSTPAVPAAPPPAPPAPVPAPAPVAPNDHPVIASLLQLLLTTAPLILKGSEAEAKEARDAKEPPK